MIDLRSDTVTRPSATMRAAMAAAEVGDDVYREDPTVRQLEQTLAARFGFEAALFFPSGTQSNLTALLCHCQRGDEYIVGQEAHTYRYEGGGAAVLGSIQPQPIPNEADGSLALTAIADNIKPDDIHFARSRLLALENTIGGRVLPLNYLDAVTSFAQERNLALHLDGARIFNAAVKLGETPERLCRGFDSVSVCLSKGLGAPAGSVLCGSNALITQALRWRKMLGGGMRQSGILAAAGLYALENNVNRLAQDHDNAALLAQKLSKIPELVLEPVQTNIVYVRVAPQHCAPLQTALQEHGVRASVSARTRLVTHLDVTRDDIERTAEVFKRFFS